MSKALELTFERQLQLVLHGSCVATRAFTEINACVASYMYKKSVCYVYTNILFWMHTPVYSCVVSEPYSENSDSRSWRYRVVDIDIFVHGPSHLLPQLREGLRRSGSDLDALMVRMVTARGVHNYHHNILSNSVWTLWQIWSACHLKILLLLLHLQSLQHKPAFFQSHQIYKSFHLVPNNYKCTNYTFVCVCA